MAPGLGMGIIGILALTLLIGYVLVQETRAHRHWRSLTEGGDIEAIRSLLEGALEGWRTGRPPRGLAASVWAGVQSAQVVEIGGDAVRLSTSVEGQYSSIEGERRLVSTPLEEATRVVARLGELVLYDVPDLRLVAVQMDVYSTFRDERGRPEQRCILSAVLDREAAATFDWEGWQPSDLLEAFRCRFRLSEDGVAVAVEPFSLIEGTAT